MCVVVVVLLLFFLPYLQVYTNWTESHCYIIQFCAVYQFCTEQK